MARGGNPIELALALLSGRAGPAWAARAERAMRALKTVLGEGPPRTPEAMFQPASGPAPGLTIGPARTAALARASEMFDALVMRRFDRLGPFLAPEIWVLWPDGELRHHPTAPLLAELASRPGKPAPLQASRPRSYTLGELKSILPRGIPEALDALLEIRYGLLITLEIDSVRGPLGRVLFPMVLDDEGELRVRSLLLGSPDDAHLASAQTASPDGESIRMVDQVIRKVVLGQAGQIKAHRSQLMEQLWVGDTLANPDQLIRMVGAGPPRLGSAEIVFMGAEIAPMSRADTLAPAGAMQKIKKGAPDAFGQSFATINPELVVVQLGKLDPASNKVAPGPKLGAIVVRAPDAATDKPRPRIGALFI